MNMKFERPRGTRDFSPEDMKSRDFLFQTMVQVFESYAYNHIETPVFENLELFTAKSGDEIVEHLYTFKDKSERDLCLRPEMTASVARMYANGLVHSRKPLKLYYFGPMYRYERPQKGRYREFWQMGAELMGASSLESDAEIICLASDCMDKLDLKYNLRLSHLGVLRGILSDSGVDEKTQDKALGCIDRDEAEELKKIVDFQLISPLLGLSADSSKGFKEFSDVVLSSIKSFPSALKAFEELKAVMGLIQSLGKEFTVDLGMSRGLAYYTGMVFDISVEGLGAQNQVCGGGRYDKLIELFGGPPTPAVGFAFGFDRLGEALKIQEKPVDVKGVDVIVVPVGDDVRAESFKIARDLRQAGLASDYDLMGRKLKDVLSFASSAGIKYAVIVGPRELKDGEIVLRDMSSKKEKRVKIKELTRQF
ncbi:histidine--tRNA ligase [Candidatus Altiarchaeota archaeon]